MGKYENKEKTRKLKIKGVWKFLFAVLTTLIGVIVMRLLDWTDCINAWDVGEAAYAIGLVIVFLVVEASTVIYRAIRKRKEKSLPPGGRWPSEARSEEERRNLTVRKTPEIRKNSNITARIPLQSPPGGGDSFSPGEAFGCFRTRFFRHADRACGCMPGERLRLQSAALKL